MDGLDPFIKWMDLNGLNKNQLFIYNPFKYFGYFFFLYYHFL